MSDIYSSLRLSPRKRQLSDSEDNGTVSPKKLRTALLTPSSISRRTTRSGVCNTSKVLPDYIARLCTLYSSLQHAISHALATCAVSPTSDSGQIRNVVNHLSIKTYAGLSSSFQLDDLKRLCWIWEWNGKALEVSASCEDGKEDNPFIDEALASSSSDWTRGGMGFLVTGTTHFSKQARQRVPAYGIGIEIQMDIDKEMGSGMAAVARWTAAASIREKEFRTKVEKWVQFHAKSESIPTIPLADLPHLTPAVKASSLTMKLATASPKGASSKTLVFPPTSSVHSPRKSPTKQAETETAIPFPVMPFPSPSKTSNLFPQTPRHKRTLVSHLTPSSKASNDDDNDDPFRTPTKQKGANAETAPATPSTSRRQALYERIRLRSLTASPTKSPTKMLKGNDTPNSKLTRDQMLKMSQEETRRRCLLGRLGGVAESVWMLFSAPTTSATPRRRRRALPASEVATAIIKSSPVPLSTAEATESLTILMQLCPFFLKKLDISGEDWLEMPASSNNAFETPSGSSSVNATPTKRSLAPPPSPGSIFDSAELIHRSPRRVKREAGGLREVREIIRRELELQD